MAHRGRGRAVATAVGGALAASLLAGVITGQARLSARGAVPLLDLQSGASSSNVIAVLAIEDARAPLSEDLRALLALARSGNVTVQRAAVRALGRLERRDVVTDLEEFLRSRDSGVAEAAASYGAWGA